jgi:hypothetical protein
VVAAGPALKAYKPGISGADPPEDVFLDPLKAHVFATGARLERK